MIALLWGIAYLLFGVVSAKAWAYWFIKVKGENWFTSVGEVFFFIFLSPAFWVGALVFQIINAFEFVVRLVSGMGTSQFFKSFFHVGKNIKSGW